MLITIMVYRFEQLSRAEVEAMLGSTLKETRIYQEIREEGHEEATAKLFSCQSTKQFGELPEQVRCSSIASLSLPVLEELSEALPDFTSLSDLQAC